MSDADAYRRASRDVNLFMMTALFHVFMAMGAGVIGLMGYWLGGALGAGVGVIAGAALFWGPMVATHVLARKYAAEEQRREHT